MAYQTIFKRYELKYLLTKEQKEKVVQAIRSYMALDQYGRTTIRNIYFDTENYRLVRRSLEAPAYKEKLRIRSYCRAVPDSTVFVELKKKYRSVVYKRRISLPQDQALACVAGQAPWPESQIGKELSYTTAFYQGLAPAVFLSYERDAFHGREDSSFRVTFDRDIQYRRQELTLSSDPWGISLLPPGQILMELKAIGSIPLWMVRTLSECGIFQTSFSKYGTAYQDIYLTHTKGEQKYA